MGVFVVTPLLAPRAGFVPQAIAVAGVVVAIGLAGVRLPARAALLAAVALAVVTSSWADGTTGTDVARGLAIAAAPLAVALAGPATGRWSRAAVLAAVTGGVLAGPVRALFDDPFLRAACSGCRHSAFAIVASPEIALILTIAGYAAITVGAIIATVFSPSLFRIVVVLLGAAGCVGVSPSILAPAGGAIAVVAGILTIADNVRIRRRLALLSAIPSGGDVLERLRTAMSDPGLLLDFAASDGDAGFVTADGEAAPGALPGQSTIPIDIGGTVVARLHTASTIEGRRDSVLSPPLLVAIEGRQLTAALAARVSELRASRARVVRRADEERRRLERDLHDGAQQHVLALGFDVRTLLVTATDPKVVDAAERCRVETGIALDELREVAHGVYPPLLASGGLAPALAALGRRTVSTISVGELPGRLPTSVERGAYLLIADLAERGVAEGGPGSGGQISVSGRLRQDRLVLTVTGGGEPSPLIRERIAALEGLLVAGDRELRAELPCG